MKKNKQILNAINLNTIFSKNETLQQYMCVHACVRVCMGLRQSFHEFQRISQSFSCTLQTPLTNLVVHLSTACVCVRDREREQYIYIIIIRVLSTTMKNYSD